MKQKDFSQKSETPFDNPPFTFEKMEPWEDGGPWDDIPCAVSRYFGCVLTEPVGPYSAGEEVDEIYLYIDGAIQLRWTDGAGEPVRVEDYTLRPVSQAEYVKKLESLLDMVSDMVECGRLQESDIPDDYMALVAKMAELSALEVSTAKPIMAITIEVGCASAVVTDSPELLPDIDFLVIDYDTDRADEEDLVPVRTLGREAGSQEVKWLDVPAYVGHWAVEKSGIDLKETLARLHQEEQDESESFGPR